MEAVLGIILGFCIAKSEYYRDLARSFKKGWNDAR